MTASKETFEHFRKLHENFLLLPDANDIVSAIMVEKAGFKAISTTSVGLGFALGCPADKAVSKDELLKVVRDMSQAVSIPIAVDLESGYADNAAGVENVVREMIQAGAVGVALEDSDGMPGQGLRPPEEHAERIRAARRAAEKEKVSLFINGRTDPFWNVDGVPEEEKAQDAIRRSNMYLEAGADGIFISGVKAIPPKILEMLIKGVKGTFSSLISAGGPGIAEMEKLGVKRLHLGSLLMRAQIGYLRQALAPVHDKGDLSLLNQYAMPTKEINGYVRPYWDKKTK